jgi:hypothetical protein
LGILKGIFRVNPHKWKIKNTEKVVTDIKTVKLNHFPVSFALSVESAVENHCTLHNRLVFFKICPHGKGCCGIGCNHIIRNLIMGQHTIDPVAILMKIIIARLVLDDLDDQQAYRQAERESKDI